MSLIRTFVHNSVLVNLIVVVVAAAGIVVYLTMPREIFPEFSLDSIEITTEYVGASPDGVEKLVTIKIEDAIDRVDGVDRIDSTSRQGVSRIVVQLKRGEDVARAINDIKAEIDDVDDFPADAEDPTVREIRSLFPVLTVSMYGMLPEVTMKKLAEELERRISEIPGTGQIGISGLRDREVWVEVSPDALERYKLRLEDVKRALISRNLNVPGGTLKTARGELLVRTIGEITTAAQVENVIVRSDPRGHHLYVRDVAKVSDNFEEPKTLGRFNGQPAINLTIIKEKRGNAIEIARQARKLIAAFEQELPPGVQLDAFNDFSIYIRNRLKTLKNTGAVGLVLVFISLFLVLNLRMALMTAFGIPFSFLGALVIMHIYGISLNMLSMFSLILVLGIVVDDAIVVGENVYRHIEEGMAPREAAVRGTLEVVWPVIATIATTIAAFIPMLLITGKIGKFMSVIPMVVSFALLASLLEALFVLPSHIADWVNGEKVRARLQQAQPFIKRLQAKYAAFLRRALRWRYVSLAFAGCCTILFILLAMYRMQFILFNEFESTNFVINIEAPVTSSLEETARRSLPVGRIVRQTIRPEELESISANVGVLYFDVNRFEMGSHLGQFIVELVEVGKRERSSEEIINEVRDRLRGVPGIVKLQVVRPQAGPTGPAIEIAIVGDEFGVLQSIAKEIQEFLSTSPAAKDVRDDYTPGKTEVKIFAKERARSLGLSLAEIATQVRQSFFGAESSKIQLSDEDIPIVVKFPAPERRRVRTIEEMMLTTPAGEKVFFNEVAELKEEPGLSKIVRSDGKRAITVLSDIDQRKGNALQITKAVIKEFGDLEQRHPGYTMEVKGERKESEESFQSLFRVSFIAILLIYLILGGLFKSYLQPVVVLVAIPFAVNGVILGHWVMGQSFSILSMLGLVALAGIVVNDSLILVELVNRLRLDGSSVEEALVRGGTLRMRPILLTSLTTAAGLIPMAFFATGQARFLSPMAQTIVWGLTFSTILTLLVLPCFYAVMEDVISLARRMFGRPQVVPGGEAVGEARLDG